MNQIWSGFVLNFFLIVQINATFNLLELICFDEEFI